MDPCSRLRASSADVMVPCRSGKKRWRSSMEEPGLERTLKASKSGEAHSSQSLESRDRQAGRRREAGVPDEVVRGVRGASRAEKTGLPRINELANKRNGNGKGCLYTCYKRALETRQTEMAQAMRTWSCGPWAVRVRLRSAGCMYKRPGPCQAP